MSKDKFSITALLLTFVGVFFIGIVIVVGIVFFNAKTIMVPDDFATIQGAVDAADPGDKILVKASGGPYEEEVFIDKEKIKLIGIGKEKPVLDGMDFALDNGITIDNTSGVLVKNFIVQKFGINGIFLDGSTNNLIKRNTVKDNVVDDDGDGIHLERSSRNIIKVNTVNNSVGDGIEVEKRSNNNLIKGNTVKGNERDGIDIERSNNSIIKGNNG